MIAELLNNCPIGVTIVSLDLKLRLYANRKVAEMFGVEMPEKMLLSPLEDSWCDAGRFEQMKTYMLSGQELNNFIAKRRRADGSVVWLSMNSQVAEVEGRQARIIWHSDVTELVTTLR